ncbi:MAG: hypothetical protein ACXVYY_01255 [Oryzihumus sp.]
MSLITQVQGLAACVDYKVADTGSKGFFATSKVADDDALYQVQVSAWLVGSKYDPTAEVSAGHEQARQALASFVATSLRPKVFPKRAPGLQEGLYGQGKVAIDGQVFQVSAQAVKIR